MKTSLRLLLIILITFKLAMMRPEYVYSQDSSATTSRVTNDEARKANEDAQAEYYRLLSKKIIEPPKSKTFWQNIVDNPASVLGILGVFVAAMVTLLSFVFNYRATLRNQKDAQFYEALKRFGDKDSPAIRSSASGILSQMAHEKKYFRTVLNQLVAGLLLEENPVVIISIGDAIKAITVYNSEMVLDALYITNLRLQDDMANSLAEFFAILHNENFGDPTKLASYLMGYETKVLLTFTNRYKKQFSESFDEALFTYKTMENGRSKERLMVLQKYLRLISQRLSANISTIESAIPIFFNIIGKLNPIQKIWWRITDSSASIPISLENAFLVKASLRYLDCEKGQGYSEVTKYDKSGQSKTSIKGSNTFKILYPFMKGAQLQNADLSQSNIKDWQFTNTFLDDTVLYGVSNYEDANFDGSNWWMADFNNPSVYISDKDKGLDSSLLDELFHRYSDIQIEDAHPSVIAYIKSKEKLLSQTGIA